MKALVMNKYGGPEVMELREMPRPEVGAQDVLIEVHAASLNPVDWKIREGQLKSVLKFDMPLIMGNELSGVVSEVGSGVSGLSEGDEVYTRVDTETASAIAEFAAVPHSLVARKPSSISHVEASGVPLAGLTAWQCLFDRMGLKSGQKVLIHAGAGGVGTLAIQFAKNAGAHVAATASAKNHDFLLQLGADEVIDYTSEDFTQKLSDYDAVLDTMGGKVQLDSMRIVKPGGWVVSISAMPDPVSAKEMGMNPVVRLFLSLMTRKEVSAAKKAGINYRFLFLQPLKEQLEEIAALIDAGTVKPVVDSVHDLDNFADAFKKIETGHARGKVAIQVRKN